MTAQPAGIGHRPSPSTMRAAVIQGPRQITVEEVAMPQPAPKEVRVRVEGCGVCASNLPLWEGREWFSYPMKAGSPGHEAWGHVDAIGDSVNHVAVGNRVAMLSYNAYAEYDVADAAAVVKLPAALDGEAFPGEPLGCAMNVFARCHVEPGQTIAIVGIGFLGAMMTQMATAAGARVVAISRRPFALEMARMMGAAEIVAMDDHHQIIRQVMNLTEGKGCERVIEAVGLQWPLDLAAELAAERGRLIIAGYHQDGPRQVNMQSWNWRGLDVVNAHERDPQVYVAGIRAAVNHVVSGWLDPSPLYTHRFKLDQLSDALEALRQRPDGFMKALITV